MFENLSVIRDFGDHKEYECVSIIHRTTNRLTRGGSSL